MRPPPPGIRRDVHWDMGLVPKHCLYLPNCASEVQATHPHQSRHKVRSVFLPRFKLHPHQVMNCKNVLSCKTCFRKRSKDAKNLSLTFPTSVWKHLLLPRLDRVASPLVGAARRMLGGARPEQTCLTASRVARTGCSRCHSPGCPERPSCWTVTRLKPDPPEPCKVLRAPQTPTAHYGPLWNAAIQCDYCHLSGTAGVSRCDTEVSVCALHEKPTPAVRVETERKK